VDNVRYISLERAGAIKLSSLSQISSSLLARLQYDGPGVSSATTKATALISIRTVHTGSWFDSYRGTTVHYCLSGTKIRRTNL
jgi:hypothetical protein